MANNRLDFSKYKPSWADQDDSDLEELGTPDALIARIEAESGSPMSAAEKQQLVDDMHNGMTFDMDVGKRASGKAGKNPLDFSRYKPSWVDDLPAYEAPKDERPAGDTPVLPVAAKPKEPGGYWDDRLAELSGLDQYMSAGQKAIYGTAQEAVGQGIRYAGTELPHDINYLLHAGNPFLQNNSEGEAETAVSDTTTPIAKSILANAHANKQAVQDYRDSQGMGEGFAGGVGGIGLSVMENPDMALTSAVSSIPVIGSAAATVLGALPGGRVFLQDYYAQLDAGATKEEAKAHALAQAAIEYGTEITPGMKFGKQLAKGEVALIKGAGRELAEKGAEEFGQEWSAEALQGGLDTLITSMGIGSKGEQKAAEQGDFDSTKDFLERTAYAGTVGSVAAGGMHAPTVSLQVAAAKGHRAAQLDAPVIGNMIDRTRQGLEERLNPPQEPASKEEIDAALDLKQQMEKAKAAGEANNAPNPNIAPEQSPAEAQAEADQREADERNNALEREYAGKTRLVKYPDGSMERVPVNPPAGHTAESVRAEREQAAKDEAERVERVELGQLTEQLRKRQEAAARKASNAEAKAEKAASTAEGQRRRLITDQVLAENPGKDLAELAPILRERLAAAPTPAVEEALPKTAKTQQKANQRVKQAAAQDKLKVNKPTPAPITKPDSALTDKELDDITSGMGLDDETLNRNGTGTKAGGTEGPTTDYIKKARDVIKGLVNVTNQKSTDVQSLLNQGKIVLLPNAGVRGKADTGQVASYSPEEGKAYIYLDNIDPANIGEAIISAIHESTHAGQFNDREGRSSLMKQIMKAKEGQAHKVVIAAAERGNVIAKKALDAALADAKGRYDRAVAAGKDVKIEDYTKYSELELLPYFLHEAAQARSGFGQVGGVVRDIKSAAREFVREKLGVPLDISLSDLDSASQRVLGEAVKTEFKGGKKVGDLHMIAGKNAKGFDSAVFKYPGLKDGLRRFEISDEDSYVSPEGMERLQDGHEVRLQDILRHSELYSNYPELRYMPVELDPSYAGTGTYASYNGPKIGIMINPDMAYGDDMLHSLLLHEVQHAIQDIEGFVEGANAKALMSKAAQREYDDAKAALDKATTQFDLGIAINSLPPHIKANWDKKFRTAPHPSPRTVESTALMFLNDGFAGSSTNGEIKRQAERFFAARRRFIEAGSKWTAAKQEAHQNYLRDYGETEARNTEHRRRWSMERRLAEPPESSMKDAEGKIAAENTIDTRKMRSGQKAPSESFRNKGEGEIDPESYGEWAEWLTSEDNASREQLRRDIENGYYHTPGVLANVKRELAFYDWAAKATKRYLDKYAGTPEDPLKDIELPNGERWEDAMDNTVWKEAENTNGKAEFSPARKPIGARALRDYIQHVGDYMMGQRLSEAELQKYDFARAVKETAADDAKKAKLAAKARVKADANLTVVRKYKDGSKWVKLDKPGQFAAESDIMGHSVRGYEPTKYILKNDAVLQAKLDRQDELIKLIEESKAKIDAAVENPKVDNAEWTRLTTESRALIAEMDAISKWDPADKARVIQVPNPDYIPESGDSGHEHYGHGGWEAIKSGKAKVYSLRDKDGRSRATIEATKNNADPEDFWEEDARFQAKYPKPSNDEAEHGGVREWQQALANWRRRIREAPEFAAYKAEMERGDTITQIKGAARDNLDAQGNPQSNGPVAAKFMPHVHDFIISQNIKDVDESTSYWNGENMHRTWPTEGPPTRESKLTLPEVEDDLNQTRPVDAKGRRDYRADLLNLRNATKDLSYFGATGKVQDALDAVDEASSALHGTAGQAIYQYRDSIDGSDIPRQVEVNQKNHDRATPNLDKKFDAAWKAVNALDNEDDLNQTSPKSKLETVQHALPTAITNLIDSSGFTGTTLREIMEHAVSSPAGDRMSAEGTVGKYRYAINKLAAQRGVSPDQLTGEIVAAIDAFVKDTETYQETKDAFDAAVEPYGLAGEALREFRDQIDNLSISMLRSRADLAQNGMPLTEKEKATYKAIRANMGGKYAHRQYASRMGKAGRKWAVTIMDDYKDAGATRTDEHAVENYRVVNNAVNLIMEQLTIPDDVSEMNADQVERLFSEWAGSVNPDAFNLDQKRAKLDEIRDQVNGDTGLMKKTAEAVIEQILGLQESKSLTAVYYNGGKIDKTIVTARSKLPKELRELLGEITDPAMRMFSTVAKQAEFIARNRMLLEIRDNAPDFHVQPPGPSGRDDIKGMEELKGDKYGPLESHWVSPQLYSMLNDHIEQLASLEMAAVMSTNNPSAVLKAGARATMDGWAKVAGATKMAQIVWNPMNFAYNFAGGGLMMLTNGNMNPKHFMKAGRTAMDIIAYAANPSFNTPEARRVTSAGITDSAFVGEINSELYKELKRTLQNMEGKTPNEFWAAVKKTGITVKELYAMMDVVYKIANFYHQADAVLPEFYAANNQTKTQAQIDREAADIVNGTNVTYKRAAPWVKSLEKSGFSNFGTFFYEVFRTQVNNVRQGIKELKRANSASTPEAAAIMRAQGSRRILGQATAWGASAYLAHLMSALAFGDDDDDKARKLRALLPDYARFKDYIVVGYDKDKNPIYFDMSRFDPVGPATDIMRAMLNGGDPDDLFESIVQLYVAPRLGSRVASAMLTATGIDKKNTPSPLVQQLLPEAYGKFLEMTAAAGVKDQTTKAWTRVAETALPGGINSWRSSNARPVAEDAVSGTALAMTYFGASMYKGEGEKNMQSAAYDYKDMISANHRAIKTFFKDHPGADSETLTNYMGTLKTEEEEKFDKIVEIHEGMVAAGKTPREMSVVLKSFELPTKTIADVKKGKFVFRSLSEKSINDAAKKEVKAAKPAEKEEVRKKWKDAKALLKVSEEEMRDE